MGAVHGKVTIDGTPLAGGRVMFAPTARDGGVNAGKPAFAPIQADGNYVLRTYKNGDGAVAGQHWVTVFPAEVQPSVAADQATLPKFGRLQLPKTQTIVAGEVNEINIQLTSQDVTRLGRK